MNLSNAKLVKSSVDIYIDKKTKCKIACKFIDKYTLLREIGRGASAVVFKGNPSLIVGIDTEGNKYAIKQISKENVPEDYIEAVNEEIRMMIGISHENIVKLYDIKQTESNYYLIMEYCSGGDLDHYRGKQLDEIIVQKIVYQISAALKVLYSKHIMHRDLKLSNLLFSSKKPGALVKLADFGFARELKRNELAKTYCGTPLYMAPEILMRKKYDLKADLWSIGVITYLFLTGHFPFEANSPQKLILTFNHGVVKFPPELSISVCCYDFLKRLLQIAPEQRMEWKEYFAHYFVCCPPEKYAANLVTAPKHDNSEGIYSSSIVYTYIRDAGKRRAGGRGKETKRSKIHRTNIKSIRRCSSKNQPNS